MSTMQSDLGLRTKIAGAAATTTVMLLSLVGVLGYRSMVEATRESQLTSLNQQIDELETQLETASVSVIASRQINSSVRVVRTGSDLPPRAPGTLQIIRRHPDQDIRALVGAVDTRRIDETLDTIRLALWISVTLIGLVVGATAWFVVDRALRPVRRLTKQAEANLASSSLDAVPVEDGTDEIAELAQTFNTMLARLRNADIERRRFVSDASHELRTPLMVLGADAEFAIDHPDDPVGTQDFAVRVVEQSSRLSHLVDDLLTLASLDETQMPPPETTTLGSVLDKSDARAAVEHLPAELDALAVPDVSRSLANLVANARTHSDDKVSVAVALNDDTVSFVVDDDGPGVPVEERSRIFTRFYRPDEDRNRTRGGAGLGLAIARAEALRVGGTLTVEDSATLGGARFTLSVPAQL